MSSGPTRPWIRDVACGHRALATTGGSTWDAAHSLCDFLESEWTALCAFFDAAPNIIELGSGTGWLGMTLARNISESGRPGTFCLTEQADGGAMEWLQHNLMENVAAGVPLSAVDLQELDWSRFEDTASRPSLPQPPAQKQGQHWDLLIGSDLIYSQAGVELLPRVLKEFATQADAASRKSDIAHFGRHMTAEESIAAPEMPCSSVVANRALFHCIYVRLGFCPKKHGQIIREECRVVSGPFAIGVQVFLAAMVLATLLYKRYQEHPPRSWLVWLMDISKQGFAMSLQHFVNVALAVIFASTEGMAGECVWYISNFMITVVGGLIVLLLGHSWTLWMRFHRIVVARYQLTWLQSGEYGDPPKIPIWLAQTTYWGFVCCLEKFTVAGLVIYPFHHRIDALIAPLETPFKSYPKTETIVAFLKSILPSCLLWAQTDLLPSALKELVLVMVIAPSVLNPIWSWIIDNLVKDLDRDTRYELQSRAVPSVNWPGPALWWPSAMMLYCHTLHRFDDFDLEFCRELRRQGLVYDVVAAAGAERKEDAGDELDPLADDCAGFLQELFPEKRIVVFHIHLPHQFANDGCLKWSASLARSIPPAPDRIEEPSVQGCREDREGNDDVVKVGRISIFLPVEGMEDRELPSGEDGVVIRLRSLGPFGSGQHPTTALVLQAMQDLDWVSIPTVCDYGCGSGVLGLVALGLGARQCLGVDNVPDALTAAYDNIKANLPRLKHAEDDEPRMRLHLPPEEMLDKDLDFYTRHGDWRHSMTLQGWLPMEATDEGSFDLVVANIVIGPLCQSAPMIRRLLRAGGQVLLAGMREFQVKQVDEAYGQDFDLKVIDTLHGWALVHGLLRRPCRDEERSSMQELASNKKRAALALTLHMSA
eukprot:s2996_g6.t1